ncbi:MAG TPA: MFS transporter [Stellaceae bacterium]|nr:MFS transporter [Stellaceae bacterium]
MGPSPRLGLFYAAYFLAVGVQLPFWPVWLAGRGLGAAEIGALLALGQWIKVAANPVLGAWADRTHDRRRFMVLLAAAGAAGYVACAPARGFAAILVPSLVAAAAMAALLPLADATALDLGARGRGTVDYGRVRLWGTLAFIAATLAGGRLLTGRSSEWVLGLVIAIAVLIVLAAALMPGATSAAGSPARAPWRTLITKRNCVFVAAAALVQGSHAVYYAFGTLYWQGLGLTDMTIAVLWAEGAVAEVVLFYAGTRLVRRAGPGALIAWGGAGAAVRWSLTPFISAAPLLALVQPLHALSFAATQLGAMHYLARRVPAGAAGTAQSLYSALVGGAGAGLAALAAGALYGKIGGLAYLAMAATAALGALLALVIARAD